MRNLKRALSLVLAAAMLIGMMVVSASATGYEDFTDKDEIVNKDAVSMLTELGVIAGKDDGSYDPTGIITRAEMAKLICVALNGGVEPSLGTKVTPTYTDIKGHWAEAYIEYCSTLGIIAGRGNGKFDPAATVTVAEAGKMLLAALGYSPEVEGLTGNDWEMNTSVLANSVKLFDGMSNVTVSAGLTRDNAAQMLYNTLNAKEVYYDNAVVVGGVTVGNSQRVERDYTMLENRFGVTVVEGVVVANEYASVVKNSSSSAAKKAGETQIEVTGEDGISGTYEVSTPVEYLGQSVTMYIKYKNSGSTTGATVFGSPILSDNNRVYTATDGDLDTLADDNDVTIDDAMLFANYGAVSKVSDLDIHQGGEIKLIDNDNDGEGDYVLYTEYTAGAVTAKNTTDDGYLTINGIGKVEDSADIVGFDDVEKGDYVLAVQYGGKTYVEKPETVTGVLEAYSTSKATVTIDDTAYDMSEIANTVSNTDPELNATIQDYVKQDGVLDVEATFYLDNNGCVLAVGEPDEANLQYAVVLGKSARTSMDDARVKLLLSDGTIANYDVDTVDGDAPTVDDANFVTQYDVVSYTVNSNDEVKLTVKGNTFMVGNDAFGDSTKEDVTVTFDSGKTRLSVNYATTDAKDATYTITNNTLFLYYDGDKVSRYVGKNDAPDLKVEAADEAFSMTVATRNAESKVATVVFVNAEAEGSFDGNYIFLYDARVSKNSDGYEVTAVVNGEKQTITVSEGITVTDGKIASSDLGLYRFSINSDETYELKAVKSTSTDDNAVVGATVVDTGSDYVLLNGNNGEYVLTNETVTVAVDTANNELTTGVTMDDGDTVTLVYNDDEEVVYAFITNDADADDGEGSGSIDASVDSITLNPTGDNQLELDVTMEKAVTTDQTVTITAQLQVYRNGEWQDTGTEKTATITDTSNPNTSGTIDFIGGNGNNYRAVVTVTITENEETATLADSYVTNECEAY